MVCYKINHIFFNIFSLILLRLLYVVEYKYIIYINKLCKGMDINSIILELRLENIEL